MPINNRELILLASEISRIKGLRVTVKESLKGGLLAGMSTFIGGLILGPAGLAIGGALGGITAAMVSNNFRSVADVILNDLSPAQQAILVHRINDIIKDLQITDFTLLLPLVLNNQALTATLLSAVTQFVNGDLSLQLIQ